MGSFLLLFSVLIGGCLDASPGETNQRFEHDQLTAHYQNHLGPPMEVQILAPTLVVGADGRHVSGMTITSTMNEEVFVEHVAADFGLLRQDAPCAFGCDFFLMDWRTQGLPNWMGIGLPQYVEARGDDLGALPVIIERGEAVRGERTMEVSFPAILGSINMTFGEEAVLPRLYEGFHPFFGNVELELDEASIEGGLPKSVPASQPLAERQPLAGPVPHLFVEADEMPPGFQVEPQKAFEGLRTQDLDFREATETGCVVQMQMHAAEDPADQDFGEATVSVSRFRMLVASSSDSGTEFGITMTRTLVGNTYEASGQDPWEPPRDACHIVDQTRSGLGWVTFVETLAGRLIDTDHASPAVVASYSIRDPNEPYLRGERFDGLLSVQSVPRSGSLSVPLAYSSAVSLVTGQWVRIIAHPEDVAAFDERPISFVGSPRP